ncbi:DCTPP1 [Symbiodinium sp. CCMP2592]|nr:DCTPP1 [Symbiodinium sp. CCMP2592]
MASDGTSCSSDGASREAVAALSKQLGIEIGAVERIFHAGMCHAETALKRRRIGEHTNSKEGPISSESKEAAAQTKFSEGISFEQLRLELADFARQRDWDQFHSPRNLALALVGEVGELCECFQWKGEVAEGLPGWSEKHRTAVRQEIADVLLYLIRLSHKCHVDLPAAALDKLAVNAAKYPAALVRGSSRKYTEYTVEGGSTSDAHQDACQRTHDECGSACCTVRHVMPDGRQCWLPLAAISASKAARSLLSNSVSAAN